MLLNYDDLQCKLFRSSDCPEWPGCETAVAANWAAHGGFFCPPNWAMETCSRFLLDQVQITSCGVSN